ncbi:MAG: tRNA 4-thiouridine(8) synthase ThiI [Desulfosalsimonadaceae bacterium]
MNENKKKVKALGLCSGGLDSMLSGVVLLRQGVEVVWVSFETPFFSAGKARRASDITGIPLIVEDIFDRYLPMLKNPPAGYGRYMNPCMDCHALMFRIAAEMMPGIGADFLFSGEVMGQRPMSQTKSSLRYVEKHSGCEGRILRPLSARRLPETEMEKTGMIDREQLLDFTGRSRKPQIRLAREWGIVDYPAPAGGCRLTDPNYAKRVKDLLDHADDVGRNDFELLKHGRHIRLSDRVKMVAGRSKADNQNIAALYRPETDISIFIPDIPGPVCLIPKGADDAMAGLGAAICAGYSQAPAGEPVQARIASPTGVAFMSVFPVKPGKNAGVTIL